MKLTIDMIGIHTDNLVSMKTFYQQILGAEIIFESADYVEFEHPGVRFALSTKKIMHDHTDEATYIDTTTGRTFELAFRVDNPTEVDEMHKQFKKQDIHIIKQPEDMPWGQRTFFFADPDGNIHEIFA